MALKGIKVLELCGLAPVPFCGLILADFGANVIRIDRVDNTGCPDLARLGRGKKSIALNISESRGADVLKRMCLNSDVIIDPYRPGILEKLGLGPNVLQGLNPALIVARISGYGQTGLMAKNAGHDINYMAMSGILSTLVHPDNAKPSPPMNLIADFAGGGLLCALGICMALIQRAKTGEGQIIDNSMTEGAAYLGSFIWKTQFQTEPNPLWGKPPGKNILDGGSPFYQTYETKDSRYMAVGSLEPKFYRSLLQGLGLKEDDYPQFGDEDRLKRKFAKCFLSKTMSEWVSIFRDRDACVTPVLTMAEASQHALHDSRHFFRKGEMASPRPAPLMSNDESIVQRKHHNEEQPLAGENTIEILETYGFTTQEIEDLVEDGIIGNFTKSQL